jgi:hypothetical protein
MRIDGGLNTDFLHNSLLQVKALIPKTDSHIRFVSFIPIQVSAFWCVSGYIVLKYVLYVVTPS